MLNCPVCKNHLANLEAFPPNCPHCGKSLMTSDEARASVQLVSDSADPDASQYEKTIDSGDSSLLPEATPHDTEAQADDPHLSNTFISDEWDDPAAGQTVQSVAIGDPPDGTHFAPGPAPDQTRAIDPASQPSTPHTPQPRASA